MIYMPLLRIGQKAFLIYGSSFISLESALSYHGWIPEAVYTTTSVTIKRPREFKTQFGMFSYQHILDESFYLGVKRIEFENNVFFMANPWRAIADFAYVFRKAWKNLDELVGDLRIDEDVIYGSYKEQLTILSERYSSIRVRKLLKKLLKEIVKAK